MYHHKYKPSTILESFVECYFIWDSEGSMLKDLIVESPPNGFCSIIFNYGDPYTLQNKKYKDLNVPRQFIAGQTIYSCKLFLQGNVGIAGIVLRPTALTTIFHLPVNEFMEERIDLCTIFRKELIDKKTAQIKSAANEIEKIQLLEDFVMDKYKFKEPELDYIDKAANYIVEQNGMLQVADLLKHSCMSRRTFERKFFQKVGLSPKYYAKIRRISYVCSLISGKKKADWRRLFYGCGFYDQSHFIKDFKEFTGHTPQQYLKENNEFTNLVETPVKSFKIT